MIGIGLIGEYDPEVKAHVAIPQALELAAHDLDYPFEAEWLATPPLEHDTEHRLEAYQALWFVPNSPYASMDGALRALSYAREQQIPTLGTCGGCQYMIIEYARNVLGMQDADHAEEHPDAKVALITPLVCSNTEIITTCLLTPGSRVAAIYGAHEVTEEYGTCNYGPNAEFWPVLEQGGLHITGADSDGTARIVEIDRHPFYIGTLFQPERSAFHQIVHPLIRALFQAARATETVGA
ncbi:MAG: glutamine amidotransferase-related protein [Ktedonobacterales bacterium]